MLVYKQGLPSYESRLLLKSLFYNVEISPLKRFVYISDTYYASRNPLFSKLRLKCFMTTNSRVPSKTFGLSRFFLNKYIDNLNVTGTLKK